MDVSQMTTGEKVEKVLYCLLLIVCSVELAAGSQYSTVMDEYDALVPGVHDSYYTNSDAAYYLFTGIYCILMLVFLFVHSCLRLRQHFSIMVAYYGTFSMMALQIGTAIFSIFSLILDSETGFTANIDRLPDSVQKSSILTLESQLTAQACLVFLIALPSLAYLLYHRHSEWTEIYFKGKLSSQGLHGSSSSYTRIR